MAAVTQAQYSEGAMSLNGVGASSTITAVKPTTITRWIAILMLAALLTIVLITIVYRRHILP